MKTKMGGNLLLDVLFDTVEYGQSLGFHINFCLSINHSLIVHVKS
jgi:hypothetical protein